MTKMPSVLDAIVIRCLHHADHHAVQQLVLGILNTEYQMELTLQELPDLDDLAQTYQAPDAAFWVAVHATRLVACIGVMPLGGGDYELRRMYVHRDYRGFGLAQKLLSTSLHWCRDHDVAAVYLETNTQWQTAQHIYEKNGFERILRSDLPARFPVVRIATDFFRLRFNAAG